MSLDRIEKALLLKWWQKFALSLCRFCLKMSWLVKSDLKSIQNLGWITWMWHYDTIKLVRFLNLRKNRSLAPRQGTCFRATYKNYDLSQQHKHLQWQFLQNFKLKMKSRTSFKTRLENFQGLTSSISGEVSSGQQRTNSGGSLATVAVDDEAEVVDLATLYSVSKIPPTPDLELSFWTL